jgi:hypothetical protein
MTTLIQRMPSLLGLSMETNVEPKLAWLGQRLVLDDKSLSLVIQRFPSLLGYNIETNLEHTIKFYEECVGSHVTRTIVAKIPSLLGSSLEKRLKPRLAECQEAGGIPIDTGTVQRMDMYIDNKWSNGLTFQKDKTIERTTTR